MLQFADPYILWLLMLLPVMIIGYICYNKWRRKKLDQLGNKYVLDKILIGVNRRRRNFKAVLKLTVFALLIIALARPGIMISHSKQSDISSDIIICLDVSESMLAEDIRPNRLENAKNALIALANRIENARIALVVFAGETNVLVPLTTDYNAVTMMARTVSTKSVHKQGTAIADAINHASTLFLRTRDADNFGQYIVLITDGEDHRGRVVEAAKKAAGNEITIFPLGIGSPAGAPIPIYKNGLLAGYKKDLNGNTVISLPNAELLEEIADITDGKFFMSSNVNAAMQRIRSEILHDSSLRKEQLSESNFEHQYMWFTGLALLLLTIDLILPYRKYKKDLFERIKNL